MTVDRAALTALVAAARALPLDRAERVQAFTLGLLVAGVENPDTLARCLTLGGITEARWRQAVEPVAQPTVHGDAG